MWKTHLGEKRVTPWGLESHMGGRNFEKGVPKGGF